MLRARERVPRQGCSPTGGHLHSQVRPTPWGSQPSLEPVQGSQALWCLDKPFMSCLLGETGDTSAPWVAALLLGPTEGLETKVGGDSQALPH